LPSNKLADGDFPRPGETLRFPELPGGLEQFRTENRCALFLELL
jgi:hypothetical protein